MHRTEFQRESVQPRTGQLHAGGIGSCGELVGGMENDVLVPQLLKHALAKKCSWHQEGGGGVKKSKITKVIWLESACSNSWRNAIKNNVEFWTPTTPLTPIKLQRTTFGGS